MIQNLYAKYLLADRLNKLCDRAGVEVDVLSIDDTAGYNVHMQASLPWDGTDHRERCELAAVKLLETCDAVGLEVNLKRSDGLIYILGTERGLSFRLYTGTGVCERVQVGTRTVKRHDPDLLAAVPLVDVEEPIFETRCVDPLAEAVAS